METNATTVERRKPTPILGYDGTFTVRSPKGGHRTFRIRTERSGAGRIPAGARVVELLTGPDNSSSFLPFGYVGKIGDDPAAADSIVVWSAYRSSDVVRRFRVSPYVSRGGTDYERFAAMLCDLAAGERSELAKVGYQFDESRVCRRCGRKLTTPESIDSGIGPICDGRDGEAAAQ